MRRRRATRAISAGQDAAEELVVVVLVGAAAAGDGAVVGDVVGVVGEQRAERLGVARRPGRREVGEEPFDLGGVAGSRAGGGSGLASTRTDLRCLDVVLADGPVPAGQVSLALKLSPAGAQALQEYGPDGLAVILDFLRTARRVQEEQAARLRVLS
ncbi:hypothetical protein GCM10017600_83830 [Streptosporangium carneum]|uniref:Uncharacterized protein n=1 Tax=Streptosporangium carneum TaxID=47481 RepID=A0A9W6IA90_9ACTN|nr:hypothetical protein GCM10017600_83830 [Streptosporangium carneum]